MKIKKGIIIFAFGSFLGGLSASAFIAKELDVLKTGLARLEGEILKVKETVRPFEQVKLINAKVTGYSNDSESINVPQWRKGVTASGTVAGKGTVAADWSVFKPGTKLFIPDYGFGTVEDRGSRVRGKHFDIFFDSREKALEWGIRQKDVLVAYKND